MPFNDVYRQQVELLIRMLPYVAEEECFALKGGTAINLFYRDMPRLSVDIDLTYLPLADRDESLARIEAALKRIAASIGSAHKGTRITESSPKTQKTIDKLVVRSQNVQIKIEVNPILRGSVNEPETMAIAQKAEDEFGFAEINVLSFADIYAGKIMAALDRQHPRDLFDVHQLLESEGITDEIHRALVVYFISHAHSPAQLLSAECRDITHDYQHNFDGMTEENIAITTLISAHAVMKHELLTNMTEDRKQFLLSFYRREPEWEVLGIEGADQLPAVRWREINLDRAGEETRTAIVANLEQVLW